MSWQKKLTPLDSELTSVDPRAATLLSRGSGTAREPAKLPLPKITNQVHPTNTPEDVLGDAREGGGVLFDDKKKGDEEEGKPVEVIVSDEEVIAAGRKTRIGLVTISIAMFAFCVGMLGYFAQQLTVVVGGSCGDSQDRYHNYEHCWNLKENWCACTQCAQGANGAAVGTAIDPSTLNPADPNVCPQGRSVCGTEAGQTEKWIEQLKRFDACRKTPPRSESALDDGPRR